MMTISAFQKKTGVHFTINHNDKMAGLSSLSTSPLCNDHCKARAKNPKTICSRCYSMTMQKRFRGLADCLKKNAEFLTEYIIAPEDMPRLYSETGFFRFEAFGDLINEIQVLNYFNMAAANPHMHCALWTKNPFIIARAMKKYGIEKPENLVILASSYFVNDIMPEFLTKYPFIDKIFTVYTKEYAAENGVEINCGARSCADCGRCYTNAGGQYVSELLK